MCFVIDWWKHLLLMPTLKTCGTRKSRTRKKRLELHVVPSYCMDITIHRHLCSKIQWLWSFLFVLLFLVDVCDRWLQRSSPCWDKEVQEGGGCGVYRSSICTDLTLTSATLPMLRCSKWTYNLHTYVYCVCSTFSHVALKLISVNT